MARVLVTSQIKTSSTLVTNVASAPETIPCCTARKGEIRFRPKTPFDKQDMALQTPQDVLDTDSLTADASTTSSSDCLASVFLIIKHILASKHDLPNVFLLTRPSISRLGISDYKTIMIQTLNFYAMDGR